MAAKHKTTKKTFKRKAVPIKQVIPVESLIPEPPTVLPNNSFQSVQPVQPVQPIVSADFIQTPAQPVQPNQPVQSIQSVQPIQPMQTVQMTSSSQPMPVLGTSSLENSNTQPEGISEDASANAEPEIKLGTEGKLSDTPTIIEKNTDQKPDASQEVAEAIKNKSAGKKNHLLPIIFIVLMGIAVLGGLFIYRQNFTSKVEEKINEVSLSPSPIVKPTIKPLDLSKFEIEILNGSGIEGEASSQRSDLEEMGFTISSIGNADNSDYTKTVIQAKKGIDKAFLDKLKVTLEKSYEVMTEELDADAETDIVVIIGSSKQP